MFFLAPVRWALRLPSLVVSAAVVYVVVSGVQVVAASVESTSAHPGSAAAIVVLPAPLASDGSPSADLTGRLEKALSLYEAHVAPEVVVGGAPVAAGATSPASVARAFLVARGVPAKAVQPLSAATAGATLSATEALLGSGAKVVVVADAVDALWTRGAASSDGLAAQFVPADGSTKLAMSDLGPLWRQTTGVAVGRVLGFSRATWAGG